MPKPMSEPPSASVPAHLPPRQEVIAALRARIGAIDAISAAAPAIGAASAPRAAAQAATPGSGGWSFGIEAIDRHLAVRPDGSERQLPATTLMEMKPCHYRDTPATMALALATAARGGAASPRRPLLLVATADFIREFGTPYAPGLGRLGIDLSALLVVTAATARDGLWALEEGLRSAALTAALGCFGAVGITAGRRLQLAAETTSTPCLAITGHADAPITVARTRWRIEALPAAPHRFDVTAPGARRWRMHLERSGLPTKGEVFQVEWRDEAHRLALVSAVADRTPAAGDPRSAAG